MSKPVGEPEPTVPATLRSCYNQTDVTKVRIPGPHVEVRVHKGAAVIVQRCKHPTENRDLVSSFGGHGPDQAFDSGGPGRKLGSGSLSIDLSGCRVHVNQSVCDDVYYLCGHDRRVHAGRHQRVVLFETGRNPVC